MSRISRLLECYIIYPVCFTAAGIAIIYFGVKPALRAMDAEICMQIVKGAPVISMEYELTIKSPGSDSTDSNSLDGENMAISAVIPAYGTQYGSITCDTIGLIAPLYYGDDEDLLRIGAGQYIGSVMPGEKGTCLIGAHDSTYFAPLEQIKIGDQIVITTNYGEFIYEVASIAIGSATEESAYQFVTDEEQVILYTCYPFGVSTDDRQERYYVYCNRVSN